MARNPGFTTQNNPWKHKQKEIEDLRKRISTLQDEKLLMPWIKDNFLSKLGTLLAFMPMENWPKEAKIAFKEAAKDAPALAHIYIKRNEESFPKLKNNQI